MAYGIKKSEQVQAQSGDILTLESAFTHDDLWTLGSGSIDESKMIEFYDGNESVFEATQESNFSQEVSSAIIYKITLDRAISEADIAKKEIYVGGDCEVLVNKKEWVAVKSLAKDSKVFDSQTLSSGQTIGTIIVLEIEKIEDNTDTLYRPKSWDSELTTLFVGGILIKV